MQTIARYLGNNLPLSENYEGIPLEEALAKFEKNLRGKLSRFRVRKHNVVKNIPSKLTRAKGPTFLTVLVGYGPSWITEIITSAFLAVTLSNDRFQR